MQFTATSCVDMSGHPFIKVVMEDGKKSVIRSLTVEQFIEVLGRSSVDDRTYVLLKKDFFPRTSKATWFSDYMNFSCVWECPAKVRLLILKTSLGEKHYHVPFPKLVFRIFVKNGQVVSKKCYAMKKGSNKLFNYPFGNVSLSGDICMGNISVSEMKSVSDFSDAFFCGITNNDYYGEDGSGKIAVKFSQEKLLEKLASLKTFPDAFLVEYGLITLKELCEWNPATDKHSYEI